MNKEKFNQKKLREVHKNILNQIKHIAIEQIVYITFGVYMLVTLSGYTVIPEISKLADISFKLLKYLCCIIFLYKAYIDLKRDGKVPLSILIFAILSILSFVFSQNRNLFLFFCALVGLRKMSIPKLIKIAYYISLVIFLSTISSSLLGVIPNWTFTRGAIIRHSLGFIFATDCIGIYLSVILMYFYLKHSSARISEIILFEILNLFLYRATDGRLSFILITVLLAILMVNKLLQPIHTNTKNKQLLTIKRIGQQLRQKVSQHHSIHTIAKVICCILPATLFIAYNSLTIAYVKDPYGMRKIDHVFSSRLKYTAQAYKKYQVPLFGKNIIWQGWGGYGYSDEIDTNNFEYNFVDSSYSRLIFDFGIIYTLAILFAYTYSITYYLKKKDYWSLVTIIFILTWSFIEPFMINLTRNPLALLLIPALELGPSVHFKKRKAKK